MSNSQIVPMDKSHRSRTVGDGRFVVRVNKEHIARVIKARRDLCVGEGYACKENV